MEQEFAERRAELAGRPCRPFRNSATLRTSLRETAQNSEFTHGVLHYYFRDKVDLILVAFRNYSFEAAILERMVLHTTQPEHLTEGSSDGPLGTAHESRTPRHSRRKS